MAHKTKKNTRKPRATWVGYYPRRTKTKKEKILNIENKHKKDITEDLSR